ncbi:Ubiquitin and WLM domain-containing metalloprotease [Ceratocystis fimbriata CBS 114723]|uniref:Ubiquitin and WLM domain-containing metalloprotease n=1 Tax=Ceratocystis fimbriata CBS 114723 TaxID=1035309 RepID=A0A2C5X0U4_9PEZI|nr:Ubiquitin and WLM domain-containing metalloprotease [Ceratocystis fimbriata CBS 114723]
MATVGDTNPLKVTFIHKNGTHVITGNHTTTLADALLDLGSLVDVEPEQLKLIVKGKMYTYAKNGSLPLANFANLSIKVMGTSKNEKQDLESASARARAPATSNQNRKPGSSTVPKPRPAPPQYGFDRIEPLQIFPNSDIAEAMLQRLSNDIGIRAAMRKFKLNVGLLTEMEPVTNTQVTHEGTTRLLGLNHNMGQAIELRLRTDNHRGFRDYKTVRLTLCHELAHNRVQDHNHEFWDFCHEIEREVAKSATFHTLDGRSGVLGSYEAADDNEMHEHVDFGGASEDANRARRELLARAAEKRLRNVDANNKKDDQSRSQGNDVSPPE